MGHPYWIKSLKEMVNKNTFKNNQKRSSDTIAGIPSLIGFFAKLGVFLSILYVEYYIIALLTGVCSVVSTFYYIRIIKILYFENVLIGKLYCPIKTSKIVLFSASVFALGFLFLNPTLMYMVLYNVVCRSLGGFK